MSLHKIRFTNLITFIPIIVVLLLFSCLGCASVPKESVELSYIIGHDLEELHKSYKLLIRRYFDSLRREVNQSIDEVFIPAYINEYVKTGKLVQHSQNKRADLVEAWARIAVETIGNERRIRLDPINKAEKVLLESVDDAFDRTIRANATITAHLNSIREVKEVQNEFLELLTLKNLRDKINDTLDKASETVGEINKDIDKAASELKTRAIEITPE